MLHTLIDERLNDDLRTTQFHVGDPPSTPCPTANPQAQRRERKLCSKRVKLQDLTLCGQDKPGTLCDGEGENAGQ
jgi:hypothetical protein